MFKIGEFSCFSRVSVKMLRHYDEINLLKPAHVDPFSSYRYYTADQLPRLNRIILFKDLGFSLEQISQLLDAELSTEETRGLLKLKRAEIQQRIEQDARRLAHLENALGQSCLPDHAVIVREVPAQLVASLRRRVAQNEIAGLFDLLETHTAQHKARALSPPLMIYHDTEFVEDEQDVEIVIPLTKPIATEDAVQVYELAGGVMACIVYTGDYTSGDALVRQFPAWLEANGYVAAGALREVYLRFGADTMNYTLPYIYLTDDSAAYVTELQLPIKPTKKLFEKRPS